MHRKWEELTEAEQLQTLYSDAHKDAYGFRPRNTSPAQRSDVAWLKAELDRLQTIIDQNFVEEEEAHKIQLRIMERRIGRRMTEENLERRAAILSLMKDDEANGDPDFMCFKNGLPYGSLNEVLKSSAPEA